MGHKAEGHVARLIRRGEEGAGHHVHEGGDDQDQHQQREHDEQLLGALAHGGLDDLTHGLAVIADRCEQGAEILQAAEEDTAKDAPQEYRHPAEHGGLDRPVDGARAGDGREVMSHKDSGRCCDVVHAVLHGLGGSLPLRVDAPLFGEPAAVGHVAHDQYGDRRENDQQCAHFTIPFDCSILRRVSSV